MDVVENLVNPGRVRLFSGIGLLRNIRIGIIGIYVLGKDGPNESAEADRQHHADSQSQYVSCFHHVFLLVGRLEWWRAFPLNLPSFHHFILFLLPGVSYAARCHGHSVRIRHASGEYINCVNPDGVSVIGISMIHVAAFNAKVNGVHTSYISHNTRADEKTQASQ